MGSVSSAEKLTVNEPRARPTLELKGVWTKDGAANRRRRLIGNGISFGIRYRI